MKRTTKTLLIATLGLLAAMPALAGHGHGHGRVVDRLERQHNRIEQGIESGELTRREARKLKRQQRRIRHLANELYEDNGLSRRDRGILDKKLGRASERIYTLKHNDEYRRRAHRSYRYRIDDNDEWPRYGYARQSQPRVGGTPRGGRR